MKPVVSLLGLLFALGPAAIASAQIVPTPNDANTTVTPVGNRLDIGGGTLSNDNKNLIHSFEQFGLNANQIANFLASPNLRNILGRIKGGQASVIDGLIQISGGSPNLYLLNPAGIIFGPNANVNVPASFTASTATHLGLGDDVWFDVFGTNQYADLVGDPEVFGFTDGVSGAIVNAGNLTAAQNLQLFGAVVANTGALKGNNVLVTAVAGTQNLRLSVPGLLLSLEVPARAFANGSPAAETLPLLLTGSALPSTGLDVAADGTVTIAATGEAIPTNPGSTLIDGTIDATGPNGGTVQVLGDRVGLFDAQIDASGLRDGGKVLVGGAFQGLGPTPAADTTYVSAGTTIAADSLTNGNGGLIVAWSEVATVFNGFASAKGGPLGGDGGTAEFSSRISLGFAGSFDLSAPNGTAGNVLFDPRSITIVSGTFADDDDQLDDGQILFPDLGIEGELDLFVSETALLDAIANGTAGTVLLQATERIDLNTGTVLTATGPQPGTVAVTFEAPSIFLADSIDFDIPGPGDLISLNLIGDVFLLGDTTITVSDDLTITGILQAEEEIIVGDRLPNIALNAGNDISVGAIDLAIFSNTIGGGSAFITAGGDFTLGSEINLSTFVGPNPGDLTIAAGGDINFPANGLIFTFGGFGTEGSGAGNITLNAGGNINLATTFDLAANSSIRIESGTVTGMAPLADDEVFNVDAPEIFLGGDILLDDISVDLLGNVTLLDDIIIAAGTNDGVSTIDPTEPIFADFSELDGFGSVVTIDGTLDGPHSLTVRAGDIVAIAGPIGADVPLTGLTFDSPLSVVGGFTLSGLADSSISIDGPFNVTDDLATSGSSLDATAMEIAIGGTVSTSPFFFSIESEGEGSEGPPILAQVAANVPGVSLTSTTGDTQVRVINTTPEALIDPPTEFGFLTEFTPDSGDASINSNANVTVEVIETAGLNTEAGDVDVIAVGSLISDSLFVDARGNQGTGDAAIAVGEDIAVAGTLAVNTSQFGEPGTGDGGDVFLNAGRDIRVGDFSLAGGVDVSTFASGGNGGSITVSAGGQISRISGNSLTTRSSTADGGMVSVTAGSDIVFTPGGGESSGVIDTRGAINAGDVSVTAGTSINSLPTDAGFLPPLVNASAGSGAGGTVSFSSGGDIDVAGGINTSSNLGPAGDVTITAVSDIAIAGSINASSRGGTGGSVLVDGRNGFIRITGTEPGLEGGLAASVRATGGAGNGDILLIHGGNGVTPFSVGDASVNGSAGVLVAGDESSTIPRDDYLFTTVVGDSTIGRAEIRSVPEPDSPITVIPEVPEVPEDPEDPPITVTPEDPVIPFDDGEDDTDEPPAVRVPRPTDGSASKEADRNVNRLIGASGLVDSNRIFTLPQAKLVLAEIEQATGARPALIYVNFVPQVFGEQYSPPLEERETQLTRAYEEYYDLPSPKTGIKVPVPAAPEDSLELLLVTPEGDPVRVVVPEAQRSEVLALAERFYKRTSTPTSRPSQYLPLGQELYDIIVGPLAADLEAQEVNNLVFIMPEGLRLLPVAALHDGDRFLVESYSTGLSPSLSLTDTRYRSLQGLRVFAAGASTFGDEDALGPLPAVSVEVPAIANQLWNGEFILDEAFTVDAFKASRRRQPTGIVHLATHADFQLDSPDENYIQFFDRRLRMDEVRELNLNSPAVELMVLSACRTAFGDRNVELGFGGLAVQAGAKSALASLWYVGDTGTLALMTEFYAELDGVTIKAQALRAAQQALISGDVRVEEGKVESDRGSFPLPPAAANSREDLSHPFYWAAFTMLGSPW